MNRLVVAGVTGLLAFVGLGLAVRVGTPAIDQWVLDHLSAGGPVNQIAKILSAVGVLGAFAVLVAVATTAWRQPDRPRRLAGLAASVAVLLACGLLVLTQGVFQRPGPPAQPGTFSFPSGHASVAGAIAVTSVVIATAYVRSRLRIVLASQATALLVTMASRVLLHEHYLTDVLGAVLGVAGIGLIGIAVAARQPVSAR